MVVNIIAFILSFFNLYISPPNIKPDIVLTSVIKNKMSILYSLPANNKPQ